MPALSLAEFAEQSAQKDLTSEAFELESPNMLEVRLDGRVWTKMGAMVCYYGDIKFAREGMFERGIGHFLKKAVSSENSTLAKAEGKGRLYLADSAKRVTVLRLSGESIIVNGNDVLAFEDTISHGITMMRKVSGMMSGGLFNVKLSGSGLVAFTTHGQPMTLTVSPSQPLTCDPNATVAWSAGLQTEIKTAISFKTLIGRGNGESLQQRFSGQGIVVVQPYEEIVRVAK
jgi:uncharacterized protein (AIM24 family)